jgi:hypothetical protein
MSLQHSGSFQTKPDQNQSPQSRLSQSSSQLLRTSNDEEQFESKQQTIDRLVSKLQKLKVEAVENKNYDQANEYRKQIDQLQSSLSLSDVKFEFIIFYFMLFLFFIY